MYFLKKRVVSQMKKTVVTELISRTDDLLPVNSSFTSTYSDAMIKTRKTMKIKNFFIVIRIAALAASNQFIRSLACIFWEFFTKLLATQYTKEGYRLLG
jgi:hypothetical protein